MNAVALKIAHHGLGNVDGEDYRRNQQVPTVVPQPREYLKRDQAQRPRQRRVLLDDREPACRKTEAIVLETAREALELLEKGELLSGPAGAKLDQDALKSFQLMTSKPFIFVFNMDAEEMDNKELQDELRSLVAPAEAIFLDAQFESELVELDEDDAREMLAESGQSESGLDKLARVGFDTLGLQTYLTAGEKEARAWTIHKGDTAPKAAGVIHTDFEKGFIKAEIVSYDDLIEAGSMAAAKAAGKVRMEGKDYVMQDGDIVEFRFNV